MKYTISLNSREWELVADEFDYQKFHLRQYDQAKRLRLYREAWQGNIPLYLHDVGVLVPDYLIELAQGVVTTEPIFSIFDKENLTFAEMIQEIWKRRKEIVKVTEGDPNPYE
ncbi:MAG: hypothetical protein ABIK67_01290 [candidate division WOR-3 bacterium]